MSHEKPTNIDAHHHFWDFHRFSYPWMTAEMNSLKRSFLPSELRPLLDRSGVDHTVFVQSQHSLEETEWALRLATENPWIAGVVGWIDLKSLHGKQQLDRFCDQPKLVGIRHIVHDESDERWLLDSDVIRGLTALSNRNLTYDLLVRPNHLPYVEELAHCVPDLRMVINHIAKPPIARSEYEPWRTNLTNVAKHPNIYCKLSGMITEADHQCWRAADLYPYIDIALELFGPQRLMFGSDWPMCLLAGEYSEVLAATHQNLIGLTANEREMIFGRTAINFYRLSV